MKTKILVLASILALFLSSGVALNLQVEVDTITEMDAYFLQYVNETDDVQRINLTAENVGSIGCQYRLRGEFHYGNRTEIMFSKPYALWSSEIATPNLYFMPENYTGEVKVEVYSYFCERQEFVENITYTQKERNLLNGTVESKTVSADKENARIKLPVQNGRLLPESTPYYWKASAAEIRNGTATLQYDPPIYNEDEKLNYTVLNENNKVLGTTTVELKTKETYWDRLEERLPRILAILLGFSVILNTRLLLDRKRRAEK